MLLCGAAMRKLPDGRSRCVVYVDSLSFPLSDFGVVVKSVKGVHLDCEFTYYAAIKETEENPSESEFIEIYSVSTENLALFTNGEGVVLSLDSSAKILNLLSDKQYECLCGLLTSQDGTTRRDL